MNNYHVQTFIPEFSELPLGTAYIPRSITSLGLSAFYQTKILSVIFESGSPLTSIGGFCFRDCRSLSSVSNFPSSITTLPAAIFEDCLALQSFTFDGQTHEESVLSIIPSIVSIELHSFSKTSFTKIIFEPQSQLQSIGDYAFSFLSALSSVVGFPIKVTKLSEGVFCGIPTLTSFTFEDQIERPAVLVIPASVESLGSGSLYKNNFTKIIFDPNSSIAVLGASIFCYCSNLVSIKNLPVLNISEGLFAHCINLQTIHFKGQSKHTGVIIPSYIKFVQSGAFFNTPFQKISFEAPSELIQLGTDVFHSCTNLTTIEGLSTRLTQIQRYTFHNCSNLRNIFFEGKEQKEGLLIIPNTLQTIGNFSFYNISIREVVFEENSCLVDIGNYAFAESPNLISVINIPKNITKLSTGLFTYSTGLKNIFFEGKEQKEGQLVIPNSVILIESKVFMFTSVAEVVFEKNSSLKVIREGIFSDCYELRSVLYWPEVIPYLPLATFYKCDNLTTFSFGSVCLGQGISLGDIKTVGKFAFHSDSNSSHFECVYKFDPAKITIEDLNERLTTALDSGLSCSDDSLCKNRSKIDSDFLSENL